MNKNSLLFNFLIIISMVIWGGSWVSAKAISGIAGPLSLTFLRFIVSVIFFIPLVIFTKTNLKISKNKIKFLLLGSISMGIYFLLFFKGLENGYANIGGVFVTSLIPIYTLLIGKFFMKRSFSLIDYIGVTIGLIGGLIIIRFWDITLENLLNSGNIYFIICPLLWALVTISSEKMGKENSSIAFSFYCHIASSIFFLFFIDRSIINVFNLGIFFWGNIFYLSVISSIIATTLYFYSTTKINSYRTSVYTFIVPTSSLIMSMVFLKEKPEISTLVGGALSILATILINYKFSLAKNPIRLQK